MLNKPKKKSFLVLVTLTSISVIPQCNACFVSCLAVLYKSAANSHQNQMII